MKEKSAYEKLKEANTCPVCNGSGEFCYDATEFEAAGYEACPKCGGTGNKIDPEIINSFVEEREREAAMHFMIHPSHYTDGPLSDYKIKKLKEKEFIDWQSHNRKRL